MKSVTLAAGGVVALAAVQVGAAVLYDSGGFAGPTYLKNADLIGQDNWAGGVAPEGARIGAGIFADGGGDQYVVLINSESNANAYGVWTHPLPATTDKFFSVTWWQAVLGNTGADSGVVLYDGTAPVASIGMNPDAKWHQFQIDVNFATGYVTTFKDGATCDTHLISPLTHTVTMVGLYTQSQTGYGYFDDMRMISAVPEPGMLAAVVTGSSLLLRPRRRVAEGA